MLNMTDAQILEVFQALATGKIGRAKARGLLGLNSYEPFPPCEGCELTDEQRRPIHTLEHVATLAAYRYLFETPGFDCCFSAEGVRNDDGTYRVDVLYVDEKCWNDPKPRGYLTVSATFKVIDASQLRSA